VYRRYRIVTGEDLRDAASKLDAASERGKVLGKVAVISENSAQLSS